MLISRLSGLTRTVKLVCCLYVIQMLCLIRFSLAVLVAVLVLGFFFRVTRILYVVAWSAPNSTAPAESWSSLQRIAAPSVDVSSVHFHLSQGLYFLHTLVVSTVDIKRPTGVHIFYTSLKIWATILYFSSHRTFSGRCRHDTRDFMMVHGYLSVLKATAHVN